MKPFVSIVTACWNQAEYLDEAIRSVLSQTYDHWEMIIIDDGSTDEPAKVVTRYRYDSRIRFVTIEHRGQSFTKSLGVRLAKGEWIAFLDADDVWEPTKLERQLEFAKANRNASILWTGRYLIVDGERREHISKSTNVTRDSLFECNPICFSSSMIRREVFEHLGLFHPTIDRSIDYDFWLRASEVASFGHLPEVLVGYRTGHANLSSNKRARMEAVMEITNENLKQRRLRFDRRIKRKARSSTLRNIAYYRRNDSPLRSLSIYWQAFREDKRFDLLLRSSMGIFAKYFRKS